MSEDHLPTMEELVKLSRAQVAETNAFVMRKGDVYEARVKANDKKGTAPIVAIIEGSVGYPEGDQSFGISPSKKGEIVTVEIVSAKRVVDSQGNLAFTKRGTEQFSFTWKPLKVTGGQKPAPAPAAKPVTASEPAPAPAVVEVEPEKTQVNPVLEEMIKLASVKVELPPEIAAMLSMSIPSELLVSTEFDWAAERIIAANEIHRAAVKEVRQKFQGVFDHLDTLYAIADRELKTPVKAKRLQELEENKAAIALSRTAATKALEEEIIKTNIQLATNFAPKFERVYDVEPYLEKGALPECSLYVIWKALEEKKLKEQQKKDQERQLMAAKEKKLADKQKRAEDKAKKLREKEQAKEAKAKAEAELVVPEEGSVPNPEIELILNMTEKSVKALTIKMCQDAIEMVEHLDDPRVSGAVEILQKRIDAASRSRKGGKESK